MRRRPKVDRDAPRDPLLDQLICCIDGQEARGPQALDQLAR